MYEGKKMTIIVFICPEVFPCLEIMSIHFLYLQSHIHYFWSYFKCNSRYNIISKYQCAYLKMEGLQANHNQNVMTTATVLSALTEDYQVSLQDHYFFAFQVGGHKCSHCALSLSRLLLLCGYPSSFLLLSLPLFVVIEETRSCFHWT